MFDRKQYTQLHYLKNKSKYQQRARDWHQKNRDKVSIANKKYTQKLRMIILNHYSKGDLKCSCCDEKKIEFLTLEHKNGDGAEHRKKVGLGLAMYRWIIKNNFPEMFKVLCMNCNWAKGKYGYCPHGMKKSKNLK